MDIKERLGLADTLHDSNSEKQREIRDKLAYMVKADFDSAVRHRSSYRFGDATADELLDRCHNQYYGVTPCEIVQAFGDMPAFNLTQLKVSALDAWIVDLLFGSGGTPFTLEPTPIPELNKDMEDEILARVKEVIFSDEETIVPKTREEMWDLTRREKRLVREAKAKEAEKACSLMEKEMWDQCLDGGYMSAFKKFLKDVCIYPYAVLEGPVPELRTQQVWSGNTLKAKDEVVYAVNHVSPFDFYWSSDSSNAQDGSYVIVRKRYSRQQLFKMAQMDSYIKENVVAALEYFSETTTNMHWLSTNKEQQTVTAWDGRSSLEVLKYYGAIKGELLAEYGITGLDKAEYYECIIHTLGHFTLKVVINPNPNASARPIYVTSYERTGYGIVGIGIAQKIRGVERAFHACLRGMIKNMEYSSGPIGEVDFSRIQQWIKDDEVGDVEPYTVSMVDPDPVGGGRPAYTFHNVPSNVGALMGVCQWFMSVADVITQIPASIHGQPVGTGANRTFRGMSMLYGNALKGVQRGITNIDDDVVSQFATALYMLNLKFNPKKEIKGDAKIIARGSSGLMEKELKKNDVLEAAQIVASLAQTGKVSPETVEEAVNRVLIALDLLPDSDEIIKQEEPTAEVDPMAMIGQDGGNAADSSLQQAEAVVQ